MECYLDNSATTAVSPPVAALALHIMTEEYGNPSSLHRRGCLAERAMTEARGAGGRRAALPPRGDHLYRGGDGKQ